MRISITAAMLGVCLAIGYTSAAADLVCTAPVCSVKGVGHVCDARGTGCGRHRRGPKYDGLGPYFNCCCNGSYKYPVPPLYTYHWPGLYSARLMTEVHSPWRFPPLRPYDDEEAAETGAVERTAATLPGAYGKSPLAERADHRRPAGEMEAMSSKLLR